MCSGSEAGSYVRLIDFVYHSTLGLRVIKKKKKFGLAHQPPVHTNEIVDEKNRMLRFHPEPGTNEWGE